MKVCHMTSAHSSFDTRIFHKECSSLAKVGYDVYLVAPGESREENGVHVIGAGKSEPSRFKRMTKFSKKIYLIALSLNCDIYHLHDPELLVFAHQLKKHGKIVIFDSHEDIFSYITEKEWIPRFLRKSVNYIATSYFRKVLTNLDALVSVTPHLHTKLAAINANTHMVRNFPLIKDSKILSDRLMSNGVFLLVFAGGVSPQWNHEQIVKVVQKLDGVEYIVYGKVEKHYIQTLKELDRNSKMKYQGQLPHEMMHEILSNASAGMALCSYSNNTDGKQGSWGNTKLFEYMQAGLPVICTDFKLWNQIIETHQCGICVDPNNLREIESAIVFLRDNPRKAKEMGSNGRNAVNCEYNWEIEEKKLFVLYHTISFVLQKA